MACACRAAAYCSGGFAMPREKRDLSARWRQRILARRLARKSRHEPVLFFYNARHYDFDILPDGSLDLVEYWEQRNAP